MAKHHKEHGSTAATEPAEPGITADAPAPPAEPPVDAPLVAPGDGLAVPWTVKIRSQFLRFPSPMRVEAPTEAEAIKAFETSTGVGWGPACSIARTN